MKRLSYFIAILLSVVLLSSCTSANPDQKAPSNPTAPQMETVQAPALPEAEPEPEIEAEPEPEPEPEEAEAEPEPEPEVTYILNKNTKKFHKPSCRSAGQISPKNYGESYGTRDEVLAQGYSPCGNCKP